MTRNDGFDPARLLRTLADNDVEFIVIGLTAAFLQGSPAVTQDLDVMPRKDPANAERLAAAMNELRARAPDTGQPLDLDGADFLDWLPRRIETDAGPIDIVPDATAIGDHDQVPCVVVRLDEIAIRVATLEAIIASKEALGRPKDLAALPALSAAKRARDEQ